MLGAPRHPSWIVDHASRSRTENARQKTTSQNGPGPALAQVPDACVSVLAGDVDRA